MKNVITFSSSIVISQIASVACKAASMSKFVPAGKRSWGFHFAGKEYYCKDKI